ncbi:MAG: hypothetical protein R2822_05090 [Spirosomataceae bacterium]
MSRTKRGDLYRPCRGGSYFVHVGFLGSGASFSSTTNSVSINFSAVATSGTLSVTANNSCRSSIARTLSVTVDSTPAQPANFTTSSPTVCQGQNAVIYTVPAVAGATSYTWAFSSTGASFSSTTNSVSINFSAAATSGTLSVTANNSCGSSIARTIAVTGQYLTDPTCQFHYLLTDGLSRAKRGDLYRPCRGRSYLRTRGLSRV